MCILAVVSTAKHIQSVRQPSVSAVIIEFLRIINASFGCIDRTTRNVDLTHAQRNTAIQSTISDGKLDLIRHINGWALLCRQGTAIYFKVHCSCGVVTAQRSPFGLNFATIYRHATTIQCVCAIISGALNFSAVQRQTATINFDGSHA